MGTQVSSWLIAIPLLGLATGLRSMTAIAVVCWFAHLGLLEVQGTWAFWTASIFSVIVFSLAALGEYVGDKLPNTPARTAPIGLSARVIFGGLVGAIVATGLQGSTTEGAILGTIGAVIGSFGGFFTRRHLVQRFSCRDWPVALFEDFVAVLITVFSLRLATS